MHGLRETLPWFILILHLHVVIGLPSIGSRTGNCTFLSIESSSHNPIPFSDQSSPSAYLAINAPAFVDENGNVIRRRLELDWFGVDPDENAKVVVFDNENLIGDPVIVLEANDYPDGFYVTDIQLANLTSEEVGYNQPAKSYCYLRTTCLHIIITHSFVSRCVFPYWIQLQSSSGDALTEARCLRNQPRWMMDNYDIFKSLSIGDMMLTAAHDASAYA